MGITCEQALDCFASDDLIGMGMEADAVRRSLHPEGVVSYGLDGRLDLQALAGNVTSVEESVGDGPLWDELRDVLEAGGTGVSVGEGLLSDRGPEWTIGLLHAIRLQIPKLRVGGFSASEVLATAQQCRISVQEILLRLHDAGLEMLAGDDAEIFDDAIRRRMTRPGCGIQGCGIQDWIDVHRAAHQLGMRSTASMRFGAGETPEQRMEHLQSLRNLQEETGGFISFELRTFQPSAMPAGAGGMDEATSVEFLKMLAISRMVLDNIENLQSSPSTQGLKVLQMGLRFGSNDVGSLTVNASAAPGKSTTEEELRRVIRDAGFRPVQRDLSYRTMFLF